MAQVQVSALSSVLVGVRVVVLAKCPVTMPRFPESTGSADGMQYENVAHAFCPAGLVPTAKVRVEFLLVSLTNPGVKTVSGPVAPQVKCPPLVMWPPDAVVPCPHTIVENSMNRIILI